MRTIRRAIAIILLFLVIFCCSSGTAETYDFGGANDNGVYGGTLAIDNTGNVAVAIAASTGELQIGGQNSGDAGGAFTTQTVNATGNRAFIGTGASNANGDTASTGALASGNALIETIQGAQAGGNGVSAGQATFMEGQNAVAGSLGVSSDGYQASTDTHISNGGSIDTMQGTAAGRISFLFINAAGAVAGQISEIFADNGGWASSTASGHGYTASTEASVSGDGGIDTIQVAGAGQIESRIEISEFFADLSVEGAFSGQESYIESNNGGYTRSNAASANGYRASTGTRYSGSGNISTIQGAAAGQVEGQLGYSEISADLSVGGAVAGQASRIASTISGTAQSCSSGNGFQAETSAEFSGSGEIDTIQGTAAGNIGSSGTTFISGALALQDSHIESIAGGTARSSAADPDGYRAETSASYEGIGHINTTQGAATGIIGISGSTSIGGTLAGQSSDIVSNGNGSASSLARSGDGTRAQTTAGFGGDGRIDTIQGALAGGNTLPGTTGMTIVGAAAGQYSNITSTSGYGAIRAPGISDVASFGGSASSFATTAAGTSANTTAEYSGNGYVNTIQGAAAGDIDISGAASVAGAVSGQSSSLVSDGSGQARTLALYNNGYDQVELMSQFAEGGSIDDITQGAAAGTVSVTDFFGIDPFEARGAAGFQESSSSPIWSCAAHSNTHLLALGSTPPSLHWVVAGTFTNTTTALEGVDGDIII